MTVFDTDDHSNSDVLAHGTNDSSVRFTIREKVEHIPLPPEKCAPFQAGARWSTLETYQMRRIVTLKDRDGKVIGFRPQIQQGRGKDRENHSAVFKITDVVDVCMAMSMAQDWRDKKEAELGINSGQISARSAERFAPGISLVVSNTMPFRAYWKWALKDYKRLIVYMGPKKGFQTAYQELVVRICGELCITPPENPKAPQPRPTQFARLLKMGVDELPDRRAEKRLGASTP